MNENLKLLILVTVVFGCIFLLGSLFGYIKDESEKNMLAEREAFMNKCLPHEKEYMCEILYKVSK